MNNDNNLNNTNTGIIEIPNEDPSISSPKPVMNLQNTSIRNDDNKVISEGFDKVNNSFYEKDKKIWPIFLIIVLLAIVGLGCYYYFVLTKPINIIKKTLNGAYTTIEKEFKSFDIDKELNTLTTKLNFIYTSNNEETKELSGISVNALVGYDFKNKDKNIFDISAELDKEKLMDFAMSVINNNTYLDFKDNYSKVVYLKDNGVFDLDIYGLDNESSQDSLYIIRTFKDALIENISEEKLSKKMLMKDVDGKKIPAIEVKYEIDYPEYKKLHNGIIDKLLNDSKFISIIAKTTGESESEIKKELNLSKDDISELDLTSKVTVTLSVEALTNKIIELVISNDEGTLKILNKSDEMSIDLTIDKDNVNIIIDKNEGKVFADAKLEDNFRFSITSKFEEVSKKEGNITFTLVLYDSEDINKEMDTFTLNMNLKMNEEIKTVDITDAVNYDELSKSEQETITNLIMGLSGFSSFEE